MSGYTEACRTLANTLGLKANVIFVDYPRECSLSSHDANRNKFPSAYFATCGECKNKSITTTINDFVHAINTAVMHAKNNAYFVFAINDNRNFTEEINKDITNIILGLKSIELRPVLINSYPVEFMNLTGLYYDDLILVKPYSNYLDIIQDEFLDEELYDQDMLNVNAMLGNGPLVPIKPMIFRKTNIEVIDTLAFAFVCYSAYKMFRKATKRNKIKLG